MTNGSLDKDLLTNGEGTRVGKGLSAPLREDLFLGVISSMVLDNSVFVTIMYKILNLFLPIEIVPNINQE